MIVILWTILGGLHVGAFIWQGDKMFITQSLLSFGVACILAKLNAKI